MELEAGSWWLAARGSELEASSLKPVVDPRGTPFSLKLLSPATLVSRRRHSSFNVLNDCVEREQQRQQEVPTSLRMAPN